MSSSTDLKQILAGAQLPALPQSAIRLLELSQNADNGPAEFAVPIEADPGLTGQVLRFVNSSYFGFAREISSVRMAITLVGVRTIKNFSLWSAVFSLMPNPKCGPFDLKSLWQDSLRRGLFARAMGKVMGMRDAEDLFAAALLQDMAVPLLAKELSQKYVSVLEARSAGERRLSEIEREKFGWTHADAAAQMARAWSLPEEFSRLIESHVDLEGTAAKLPAEPGPFCVALSALLPAAADETWSDRTTLVDAFTAARPDGPTLDELLAQVDTQFAEFAPVLKVSTPKRSLVECLLAEAQPA
jgi:HD-like signal output (HDOD) protein